MAHPKHDLVRQRYGARCGYCEVSEEEVGGELTVDHFIPLSAGGDEGDDNLVYACHRCNLYKRDFSPTAEDRGLGHEVLHPLRDKLAEHLRLDLQTGLFLPKTERGRFHLTLLHLNRPALAALRLRRRQDALRLARSELLEAENRELRAILEAQQDYLMRLLKLLQGPDVE